MLDLMDVLQLTDQLAKIITSMLLLGHITVLRT